MSFCFHFQTIQMIKLLINHSTLFFSPPVHFSASIFHLNISCNFIFFFTSFKKKFYSKNTDMKWKKCGELNGFFWIQTRCCSYSPPSPTLLLLLLVSTRTHIQFCLITSILCLLIKILNNYIQEPQPSNRHVLSIWMPFCVADAFHTML